MSSDTFYIKKVGKNNFHVIRDSERSGVMAMTAADSIDQAKSAAEMLAAATGGQYIGLVYSTAIKGGV